MLAEVRTAIEIAHDLGDNGIHVQLLRLFVDGQDIARGCCNVHLLAHNRQTEDFTSVAEVFPESQSVPP